MKNPNPSAQMETVKVCFCSLEMQQTTCGKSINTGLTSSITTQTYKQRIQIQQTCMPADKATHLRCPATIYRLIQSVKVNPSPIFICDTRFLRFIHLGFFSISERCKRLVLVRLWENKKVRDPAELESICKLVPYGDPS